MGDRLRDCRTENIYTRNTLVIGFSYAAVAVWLWLAKQSWRKKSAPRSENRGYAYEKRAPPYVGMSPRTRMVYPALHRSYEEPVAEFMRESIIVRDSFGSC